MDKNYLRAESRSSKESPDSALSSAPEKAPRGEDSASSSPASSFSSKKDFYTKLGIYLRAVTGSSCKFKVEDVSEDFITLLIYAPTRHRKGVKISSFLDFFSLGKSERPQGAKDSAERSDGAADYGGGGA